MRDLAVTTQVDPVTQRKIAVSLSTQNAAAIDRFVSLLWQYLESNYHPVADFNAFVNSLQKQTVSQIQIGNKLRLRATSDGGVIELLSPDGTTWLPQQTFKQIAGS